MTFFDKLKTEAAPYIAKFKASSALTQIGVTVGALVAIYVVATMLPALLFLAALGAMGYGFYILVKSDQTK